jgi:hypothetical protein
MMSKVGLIALGQKGPACCADLDKAIACTSASISGQRRPAQTLQRFRPLKVGEAARVLSLTIGGDQSNAAMATRRSAVGASC